MADTGTYFLQTLGCPKNQVDASYIEGVMERDGYSAVAVPEQADVAIVHTCGFIESAAQESVDALLELGELKRRSPGMRVVATGCLAQRHGADLAQAMPELDAVIGTRDWPRLPEALAQRSTGRPVVRVEELRPVDYSQLEFRPTGPATTYLKLSDGCDYRCAFCTIPSFTGRLRSKPPDLVVEEARRSLEAGVRELVLVAQDLTGYGRDLTQPASLAGLLRRLAALRPQPLWIRLMYATLEGVDRELIDTIAELDCVAKYVDMPLQHVHPVTLRRMRRPYSADRALSTLADLRAAMPDLAIRSTFVVGFPGETDEEFQHLLDFLPAAHLDWVTAFAYSEEHGTAAASMPNQVPVPERARRRRAVYSAQAPWSRVRNRRLLGTTLSVLVEAVSPGTGDADPVLLGRSHREAPEVDGRVVIRGVADPSTLLDRVVDVRITTTATYQVAGVLSSDESPVVAQPRRRPLLALTVSGGGGD